MVGSDAKENFDLKALSHDKMNWVYTKCQNPLSHEFHECHAIG